ncbi:MAG: transglutaminase family protein [Leptospiraceae bacterium]|nr:transglutaminase family protein [Leptospiraceae bacterium]
MQNNLKPTFYLDFDSEIIQSFITKLDLQNLTEIEKAKRIYLAVRDEIRYDPYNIILTPEEVKASLVIKRGYGYCVEKAVTLAACIRAVGIPAKVGFANVKNHINSKRLQNLMLSDIFVFHGYAEIFLNGKWVKATPAFNKSLCERAGILPLEFDGEHDSIFHPFDKSGKKHMEYLCDHGSFDDLPYERMIEEYDKSYPHLKVKENKSFGNVKKAKFEDEVIR